MARHTEDLANGQTYRRPGKWPGILLLLPLAPLLVHLIVHGKGTAGVGVFGQSNLSPGFPFTNTNPPHYDSFGPQVQNTQEVQNSEPISTTSL